MNFTCMKMQIENAWPEKQTSRDADLIDSFALFVLSVLCLSTVTTFDDKKKIDK